MKTLSINLATGPKTFKLISLTKIDNQRFVVYKDGEGYTIACLDSNDCFVLPSRFSFVLDDAMDIFNKTISYCREMKTRQLINAACDKH